MVADDRLGGGWSHGGKTVMAANAGAPQFSFIGQMVADVEAKR